MKRIYRRFGYLILILAVLLACGTVGFTLIDDYPPFDAFYMTLTTIVTVGYGEIHPLSRMGRIFNVGLIIAGVTLVFLLIGALTQTVIELELGEVYEKRRTKRMIDNLNDHYIVCGFGRVGRGAAVELQRAGVPFVVVDNSPERVERAMRSGMIACLADSTRDQTLREVGVERAHGLVSALSSDADNLFVILSARNLNPQIFLAARAAEEEAEHKMKLAGADVVFAPYLSAGHRLAQAMIRPHVHQFLDFANLGMNVAIEQVRVSDKSAFRSQSLQQMQLRRDFGVIVLAIRKSDGEMQFNPPADAKIEASDHLIVMGEPPSLRRLETLLT